MGAGGNVPEQTAHVPDFVKDHLFEALLAIIGALALYIVQAEINHAREELLKTQCAVAKLETNNELRKVEYEIMSGNLEDLQVNSPQLDSLANLKETFGEDLGKCTGGNDLLKTVSA
jgi:hypothetical protein